MHCRAARKKRSVVRYCTMHIYPFCPLWYRSAATAARSNSFGLSIHTLYTWPILHRFSPEAPSCHRTVVSFRYRLANDGKGLLGRQTHRMFVYQTAAEIGLASWYQIDWKIIWGRCELDYWREVYFLDILSYLNPPAQFSRILVSPLIG